MKALRIEGPNKAAVREVDKPKPGPGEVLVRVRAAAICTGDAELLEGGNVDEGVAYPMTPGHEWAGVVEEAPKELAELVGKRVVGENIVNCGECAWCLRGRANLCDKFLERGFTLDGAFAEYKLTSAATVHLLPDEVSFEAGALVEPTAVALHGLHLAEPEVAESVLVIGAGPIGIVAIACARALGAGEVVMYGRREKRLELSGEFGADEVIDGAKEKDLAEALRSRKLAPPQLIVEATGNGRALNEVIRIAPKGARIVLLSTYAGEEVPIYANGVVLKELEILGSMSAIGERWAEAVRLIASGDVPAGKMVTHKMPLSEFAEGFRLIREERDKAVKVILEP